MSPTLLSSIRSLCVSCLVTGLSFTSTLPARAQSRPAPLADAPLAKRLRGAEALQALGGRLREVAEFHRLSEAQLRGLFERDKSLWVDQRGRLLYVCEFAAPQPGPVGESTNTPPLNPLYSLDQTFKLHSRPGASRVIFLDFDGHDASTTVWGGTQANTPFNRPYDTDGNPNSFSTTERQNIQYIWARVAEDYMQYDIDVTTEDPGAGALKNLGNGRYGVRAVIGGDWSDWFGSSAGGVAYVGSFDDAQDLPCQIFPKSLGDNEKNIAEACSHEVGHTLGLSHDGLTTGAEYYTGQGNWAPIMGVGYDRPIVQWSSGEYASANNTEDDLTRMLSFGAINRVDDYGNNIATANPLSGVKPALWGVISSRTDVDFFSFEAGAGPVTITASPAPRGPNLRIQLTLYDGTGSTITSAVVADSATSGMLPVTISTTLPTGNYFVSVDGVGNGSPLTTGYSDYSSLGQYTLSVTLPGDGSWTAASGGNYLWTNTANWSSATIPLGRSGVARLVNDISGDQSLEIDRPITLGGLAIGDADSSHAFTIQASGSGGLRFGTTNGSAWISKLTGQTDIISAPLQLLSNLAITNSAPADLVLAGPLSGSGVLTKFGPGQLRLSGTNSLSNGLIIGSGTVLLDSTASVEAVASITLQTGAILDVTAQPSWQFAAPNLLIGHGTITGNVATASGFQIAPGTPGHPGSLAFANQLTLNDNAVLDFHIGATTNVGTGINDLITVAGDLTLSGTIAVHFDFSGGLPDTNGTYTILTYGGTLIGGATNFSATSASDRFTYEFDDSVAGEIRLHISGAPTALVWLGDANNLWDVGGSTNWIGDNGPEGFLQGDAVRFDASGSATPVINLNGSLAPSSVTISNVSGYTLNGSGRITGPTGLTKQGAGILTIQNSNDFSGATIVEEGTLQIGNIAALGLTNSDTIVSNIGQLDLNGFAVGNERLVLSGNGPAGAGALLNSGATQTNALRNLTLTGDATIGGSGRWDLRGIPAASIPANLTGNGFALTKTGNNQIWLANLGSVSLGNITVDQGTLGFEGANDIVSNGSPVTVNAGATLAFLSAFDFDFNKPVVLNSATVQNDSGHNILGGPVSLANTTTASVGEAATLDLRGSVSGSGGLTKIGVGILRLAGANSFTGDLLINEGTVVAGNNSALGTTSGTTTIASGARLDVAAFNLGAEPIFVTGTGINNRGAIVNSLPTAQPFALRFVTLTGNTTFGGNGRWDIRGNPTGSLLGAFDLTKVGDDEVWLANLGATQLRNIIINEGTLGFQGTTTMGNAANTITVTSGTTLAINGTGANVLSKTTISSTTGRIINTTGSNVFTGTLSLSGSNQLDIATASTLAINGNIAGTGFFEKTSTGTLVAGGTVAATGANRVSAGTLQIGAGGLTGTLNGNLINNGTLIFNRRSDLNHSAVVAGTGAVIKQNTNVLTLSAANSYSGATTISAGTLRVGNSSALGTTTSGTTVGNGATLDINGISVGTEAITVSGTGVASSGAVVNSGADQTSALRTLTLTGSTTLGGDNRWDVRGSSGLGTLSSSGQPYVLTKTGLNTIGLNNVTVDAALGNVDVLQGVLSIEQGTTGLGNPAFTVTVSSNATLNLYSLTNALNKVIILAAGGKLAHSGPGAGGISSTVSGPITLSGGNALVENSSTAYVLQINNAISGFGNLNLTGAGLVQLNSANNYSGATLLSAGICKLGPAGTLSATPVISIAYGAVLDVSSLGAGFVLGPVQSLTGNGTVLGNVIANGTVSPGASVGRLSITGNATLAGQTFMELSKSGVALTNDVLSVSGMLTCGGTLAAAQSGSPLAANDSFRLFSAGAITGSFANYSLPTLGLGLAWDTSTVNSDGWLRVVSNAVPVIIGSVGITDGNIVIAGSGGTPGATYHVLSAFDVALPFPQWLSLATNIFDVNGNFAFTNAIYSTNEQQFFRLHIP